MSLPSLWDRVALRVFVVVTAVPKEKLCLSETSVFFEHMNTSESLWDLEQVILLAVG